MQDIDNNEVDDRVAVVNPQDQGRPAYWFWDGRPYELKPGEVKAMKPFMADHARKHNPWLFVGDMKSNQGDFAKMAEIAAQARVDAKRQELERAAEELRKAQAAQVQAAANRKAQEEEAARKAAEEEEARQLAHKHEQERLEAAKKAAGAKPKH